MKRLLALLLILLSASWAFAQNAAQNSAVQMDFSGVVKWDDSSLINAQISLDLATAGVKLPAGRTYGEALLKDAYFNHMRPFLLSLQYDSSTILGDLVDKGELTLAQIDSLALHATSKAPALSPDMRRITSFHSISLSKMRVYLMHLNRPTAGNFVGGSAGNFVGSTSIPRVLNPVSTAQYTGIIIIATEELPIHGMKSKSFAVPCLFPKIWDSEMNLLFDKNMLDIKKENINTITYSSADNIFKKDNPSGLSKELQNIVGEKPLRIFASGVFGMKPTDIIIDRNDALLIISSEENRRLLSQGRVVFIMDDAVLESKISE